MDSFSFAPYIGNDEYITLISCAQDHTAAERFIKKPLLEGVRIWFDFENSPEDNIAESLIKNIDGCSVCFALLTNNAVNSHYFRSGLTYAVNSGKPVVLVRSENIPLSIGMQIQAAATIQIDRYSLSSDEFYARLFDIKEVRKCCDTKSDKISTMYLERDKTKDLIILKSGATTLGRHATMCDYVIDDNKYIGRVHATIINSGSKCVIIDNNSKNKTYVNARTLVPDEQFRLYDNDIIILANEKFIFHQS